MVERMRDVGGGRESRGFWGRGGLVDEIGISGGTYCRLETKEDGRVDLRPVVDLLEQERGEGLVPRVVLDLDGLVMPSCVDVTRAALIDLGEFARQPVNFVREEGRVGLRVWRRLAKIAQLAEVTILTSRLPLKNKPKWLGGVCCFPWLDSGSIERIEQLGKGKIIVRMGKPPLGGYYLEDFLEEERGGCKGRVVVVGSSRGDLKRAGEFFDRNPRVNGVYFDGGGWVI